MRLNHFQTEGAEKGLSRINPDEYRVILRKKITRYLDESGKEMKTMGHARLVYALRRSRR